MKRVVWAVVLTLGLAMPAAAQTMAAPLSAAKDLYAAARYDEALTVLNGLRIGEDADRKSVEQYRSLCLLALGRADEAESAIAQVVTADPMYRPAEADAAPRVRSMFTDVRRRLLPEIAQSRYKEAKSAYDRQEWAVAEARFRMVLGLIDDPDSGGQLSDLRELTVGFLELSAKAAAPPPRPPAPEPEPKAVEAPAPPRPDPNKVYAHDDPAIVPTSIVKQDIPPVPTSVVALAKPKGVLELVIDELGRVVSMQMRAPIHPAYDAQILAAARDWKYLPATFNGAPVKSRKLIQIAVKR